MRMENSEIKEWAEHKTPLERIYANIQEKRNKVVEEKYEENAKSKIRYRRGGSRRHEFNGTQYNNRYTNRSKKYLDFGSWPNYKKDGTYINQSTSLISNYTMRNISNYMMRKKEYTTKTNYTSKSIYL